MLYYDHFFSFLLVWLLDFFCDFLISGFFLRRINSGVSHFCFIPLNFLAIAELWSAIAPNNYIASYTRISNYYIDYLLAWMHYY